MIFRRVLQQLLTKSVRNYNPQPACTAHVFDCTSRQPRQAVGLQLVDRGTGLFGGRGIASVTATSKPRLVVLGSGWSAASLAKHVDLNQYALTVVSRLNHMVFTPMLPGAAVGTVECRSTAVNMFAIQPKLKEWPNVFYTGEAVAVDPTAKQVTCKDALGGEYTVPYDVLAVATGSQGSTFGTPGVEENALFLREVSHASAIRDALIRNWQLARSPGQSEQEKKRLLHTVIVGGGPTGVEFAGELSDLISSDLRNIDGHRAGQAKVTIVEAQELLGNFDAALRTYAAKKLRRRNIDIVEKGMVKELRATEAVLSDGRVIPFGLCVWSTGVGPTDFISGLPFAKTARGRIAVDEFLRVLAAPGGSGGNSGSQATPKVDATRTEHPVQHDGKGELVPLKDVYALGDCCANTETPLPALAQVAEQQGQYLAKALSGGSLNPFKWSQLGTMATVGSGTAIIELGEHSGRHINWKGFSSFLAWRSAYLTRLGTFRNRFQVMTNWLYTAIFGRDVSRW